MSSPFYELLGFSLPSGSWANWFAGLASTSAVVVALSAQWIADCRRKADIDRDEKNQALQIARKLLGVLNSSHDIYRHFWVAPDPRFLGIDGKVERWRSTFPLIGVELDPSLALNEAQINFLMRSQEADLLMRAHREFGRYQSLISTVHEYANTYRLMRDNGPSPNSVSGGVMSANLTKDQVMAMMPRVATMEGLITSIRESSLENVREAWENLNHYDRAMQKKYGKSLVTFGWDDKVGSMDDLGKELPRN